MSTQGLFGGGDIGDEQKAKAQDFISRYQTGKPSEGYTEKEAVQALEEVSKVATPEQMQKAFQQSVANLPEDERAQFNQMLEQRKAGTGMVDIQRSGERTDVSSREEAQGASGGGSAPGLDDLLGGLLGGMAGGSAGGSGGGLGDILGGLLGGAAGASGSTGATAPSGESKDSGDGGGGLGDILSGFLGSPAGKAVLAGTAAFAMKEVLGDQK